MDTSTKFSLLLSLSIIFSSAAALSISEMVTEEDPLIRQVVSGIEDHLLDADHHFASFKSKFGKNYATQEEHDHRFSVFKSNLLLAKSHQLMDPSAVHGITKFMDLTPKEFRQQHLGMRKLQVPSDANKAPVLPTKDLPTDFDWRDHGAVGKVKDQGSCGSCWSFSVTGALEGAHFLSTGKLVSLSEQQLVDCDHECDPSQYGACDAGCNGGLMTSAYEYTLKAGGLEREEDYPYTGTDGTCKFDKNKIVASVANFSVVSSDEDQIAANLVKHGPLSNIHRRRFMPLHLPQESGPRRAACWIWICWIRTNPFEGKALLDHQELVGRELGRRWVLQDLQGNWQEPVWHGHNGFLCCCHDRRSSVDVEYVEALLCWFWEGVFELLQTIRPNWSSLCI
ncbi:Cysteine protease RD19A [Linum perenne]